MIAVLRRNFGDGSESQVKRTFVSAALRTMQSKLITFLACAAASWPACLQATPDVSNREMRFGPRATAVHSTPMQRAASLEYRELMGLGRRDGALPTTTQDNRFFSGIGAIVCRTQHTVRTTTAFLIGRFDVAVTVAHLFFAKDHWLEPAQCTYAQTDLAGYVRERIPVTRVTAQWLDEPATHGRSEADWAVVRLARPVLMARRTMAFTKLASVAVPALLVGYRGRDGLDTLRRKSSGYVFPRTSAGCVPFLLGMDARGFSAGAPLVDPRTNAVIGMHTRWSERDGSQPCQGPTHGMIAMNEWLERTLRHEIATESDEHGITGATSETKLEP